MSRNRFIVFSVFFDGLVVNVGFVLAFIIGLGGHVPPDQVQNLPVYAAVSPIITLFYLFGAWTYGLYDPERADTAWLVARGVFAATFAGTILFAAVAFFGGPRSQSFARRVVLLAGPIEFTVLFGWRLGFLRFGRITWPEQRVLIVGVNDTSVELASEVARRDKWGWKLAGLVDPSLEGEPTVGATVEGHPVRGRVGDIARIAAETRANRVIVVSPIALRELVEGLVLADEVRVRVDVVPELYEIFIGTVDAIVGDVPLMEITRSTVPRYYAAAKRGLDLLGSLLLLVLVSPILLVAAIAIVLTDGLPIVYSQERSGRNRKPFPVYKLRTMVKDAERHSGAVLAEEDDPRITRVGRFLRKTRVDELPQLFNIIRGDMSFIGPRPERPVFVEEFCRDIPGYRERFSVKPGVTGLAQVSGGYATTPDRKLKYDLIYMYHQNLAMDIQIVAETLRVVLTGRGAR